MDTSWLHLHLSARVSPPQVPGTRALADPGLRNQGILRPNPESGGPVYTENICYKSFAQIRDLKTRCRGAVKRGGYHPVCDYCSAGDLYTYWVTKGQLGEDVARVFAAELGCALGFLHDFGIIHRDVKMENILLTDQGHIRLSDFGLAHRLQRGGRAFTICGTIQYMAPEVLSGGPYNHAADWWSLGILLFSLVAGKFPVSPDPEHSSMLRKVHSFQYVMPATFSPPLALLLTELLCKTPIRRLRSLERFKRQTFFRGTSFDSQLLQKAPVELILQLKSHPDRLAQAQRGLTPGSFQNFDCDLLYTPDSPSDLSPTLTKIDLSPGLYSETDTPVTP